LNAAIAVVLRLFWSELGRWLTLHLVTKPKFCLPLAKMILISTWFLYGCFPFRVAAIVDGTAPGSMLIPAIDPARQPDSHSVVH
jgi:hypothetical protein